VSRIEIDGGTVAANGSVKIGELTIANDRPFVLIAGPCALESRQHALEMGQALSEMTGKLGLGLIYKSSFDKANRTSMASNRGLGMAEGLPILAEVRETYGCPVLTDVHAAEQCRPVAEAVDVLQIPAFLCRQTDLLVAAAETGRAINVKKGQFLAPWDMKNVARKIKDSGNDRVMVCERGASFGYNTLVSDMRRARPRAASANSSRCWPAPRSRSARRRSSWRLTRTRTTPPPTAPTWCASRICRPCSRP
jgi:2-dehydro-3-deoxyphosphooctonate aldolase (KDO 8-P synthase)